MQGQARPPDDQTMNFRVRIILTVAILALAAIFSTSQTVNGGTPVVPFQNPPPETPPDLFDPGEIPISVFGETANGNVTEVPTQTTTTTTTTTTVGGPTPIPPPPPKPSPSGSPINTESHRQLHKHPGLLGATAGDPSGTTKEVHTSKHHFNVNHISHNLGGGGIQGGYFFTRYLGILADLAFLGGDDYATAATGNIVFRYPFEFGARSSSGYSKDGQDTGTGPTWGIAPYVIAGGGAQWQPECLGIADIGAGLELRWSKNYGFFIETRWIVHDHSQNYFATTAGVTFAY
jgi:hypothetical protein